MTTCLSAASANVICQDILLVTEKVWQLIEILIFFNRSQRFKQIKDQTFVQKKKNHPEPEFKSLSLQI